jgi:hypothetical protein
VSLWLQVSTRTPTLVGPGESAATTARFLRFYPNPPANSAGSWRSVLKKLSALLALSFSLVCAPHFSLADSLHFVSDGGQSVGGVDVYPYNFSIDGSSTLNSLMCLDFNREISMGETWNVNVMSVPLDNSQSSIDYRADAWIYSQLGIYSNADVQYGVWDIFDPTGVNGHAGFNATAQQLAQTGLMMAQNQTLIQSGFFSGFTLYTPTDSQAGWTNGEPQDFVGTAQAPEPSSFVLLGSGLIGTAGAIRRKLARR